MLLYATMAAPRGRRHRVGCWSWRVNMAKVTAMGVKQVAGAAKPAMLIGASRGLSSAEAGSRLGAGDRNRVGSPAEAPLHELLRSALTERLVLLLVVVCVVYGVLRDYQDAAIIFAV